MDGARGEKDTTTTTTKTKEGGEERGGVTQWKVVCWDSVGAERGGESVDDISDVHFNTQPKEDGDVSTQPVVEEEDSLSDVVFTSVARGGVERYSQTQSGDLSQPPWSFLVAANDDSSCDVFYHDQQAPGARVLVEATAVGGTEGGSQGTSSAGPAEGLFSVMSEDTCAPDVAEAAESHGDSDEDVELVEHVSGAARMTLDGDDEDDEDDDDMDDVVMGGNTGKGGVRKLEDEDENDDDDVWINGIRVDSGEGTWAEEHDSGDDDDDDDRVFFQDSGLSQSPMFVVDESDDDESDGSDLSDEDGMFEDMRPRARKTPFEISDDDDEENGNGGDRQVQLRTGRQAFLSVSDDEDEDDVIFAAEAGGHPCMTVSSSSSEDEDEDEDNGGKMVDRSPGSILDTLGDSDEEAESDRDRDVPAHQPPRRRSSAGKTTGMEDVEEEESEEERLAAVALSVRAQLCVGNIPTLCETSEDSTTEGTAPPPFVEREKECAYIREYLGACRFAGVSGCFYVSGPPGTGKTTAVRGIVAEACRAYAAGGHRDACWQEVYLNCIRLSCTSQSELFAHVARRLGCRRATQDAVHARVCDAAAPPVALVVDEADALFARAHRRALFALFTLPLLAGARCVLVAIANASRPPPAFWKKLRSRIGLWHVHFGPYTAAALERIAHSRLRAVPGAAAVLAPDTLRAVAVRLAVTCGDARRMLHVCRSAIDYALARHAAASSASGASDASVPASQRRPFVRECDTEQAIEEAVVQDARTAVVAGLSPAQALALALLQRRTAGGGGVAASWVAVDALVDACARPWRRHAAGSAPPSHADAVRWLCRLARMGVVALDRGRRALPPALWRAQCTVPHDVIATAVCHRPETQHALEELGWLP